MSNIHRYFGNREGVCPICPELFPICIQFNPQLVIETLVENHDKKPKDQRNF